MAEPHGVEVKVKLAILGFEGNASAISTILKLRPARTWRKGETVTALATNIHHQIGWLIQSPADPLNSSVDEAVRGLLDTIREPQLFAALPREAEVQLTCTILGYDQRPGLYLE